MYNLTELYKIIGAEHGEELWNGSFACAQPDIRRTFLTNVIEEPVACYTFTLVRQGKLLLETGGQTIDFGVDDMYIHLPGFPVRILSLSDDYKSTVLLVDEQSTYETAAFRNLIRTSYHPHMQYSRRKLTMTPDEASRLNADMISIRDHISHPTSFCDESLRMLFSVFIFDLIDIQEKTFNSVKISRRTEDIFVLFYSLARQNYIEHHDIGFYADSLNITTTYLSRVVKQITGHTVIEYINQMLATEATWLLSSTDLSVGQIADRLHFATAASFDKFFVRMCGKLPKECRRK